MIIKAEPPPEVAHELALLQENALITPEAARALTVASANLTTMKRVSTGVGQRHFNKIDTLLSVRKPTPVSEAREVLATLGQTWESLAGDFHKYRKLHYQAKLLRAKLNKTKNGVLGALEGMDADDRAIAEAQAALDQASIDEIEAEVAMGHGALKIALEQATAASTKYAAICTAAGKDPNAGGFTEDDFLTEEADYYLKSAFWHASLVMNVVEFGDPKHPIPPVKKVRMAQEVRLYFEGMDVTWVMVQQELGKLYESNYNLALLNGSRDMEAEKQTRFHQWLDRMVEKYRTQALAALKQHGPGRLKRLAELLDPKDKSAMRPGKEAIERDRIDE